MGQAARLAVAVGYTFAAWVMAGTVIYAGTYAVPGPLRAAIRYGGLVCSFVPVFRLYFRRPTPLPPAGAAALAIAFIGLLDLYLLSPHFLHTYDPFLSFWDWQFPAVLVAASVYGTGRVAHTSPQGTLN